MRGQHVVTAVAVPVQGGVWQLLAERHEAHAERYGARFERGHRFREEGRHRLRLVVRHKHGVAVAVHRLIIEARRVDGALRLGQG